MKLTFPNGYVYIMSEEEAEEAIQYLYTYGIKEFKIKYKHKRVNKDETANI